MGRLSTTNVGRKLSDETKNKIRMKHIGKETKNKGMIWITNGIKNKYIYKTESIPEGWSRGLTRFKKD